MTALSVSNSEVGTYLDCRRRWWLSYYRRLRPIEQSIVGPLPLGSRVHAALEAHYKDGANLEDAYRDLLAMDRDRLTQTMDDPEKFEGEAELGRLMIEGFGPWADEEGIDANFELVGVEEILQASMMDGRVTLKGKIDQRIRDLRDGVHLMRDWKTVAQAETYTRWAHMNPQLLTYMLLDFINTPGERRIAGGQFILLRKVKRGPRARGPFYIVADIRHNVFTLRSFWTRLNGIFQDMLSTTEALDSGLDPRQVVYPHPSRDCSWKCPFFHVCPMFDDGSAAEDMLAAEFEEGDPYDYYENPQKESDA